ncbi:MAG: RNA polymerase factor sigma-54 [Deltaproteobacteria bacterium]|nr:RNA polymerase factor sigma-54 [Deltaproteobacteria bacterium]
MALEIKQSLRLSQQLVITPQLQQAIKLLQLSRMELENLIQHELTENPVLEEQAEQEARPAEEKEDSVTDPATLTHEVHDKEQKADEVGTKDGELKEPTNFDWENYLGTYNTADSEPRQGNGDFSDEAPSYENKPPSSANLQDHLLWQLHLSDMDGEESSIAEDLIGDINEEGYYQGDLQEQAENHNTTRDRVEFVLKMIQEFDPTGVGARDLKECLMLQIVPFGKERALLERLIDHYLEDLERRNYGAITKGLGISNERLRELAHIISTLEPKPGRPFGGENPQYIIPDVYIHKVGNDYIVSLNDDGLPKLQVSSFYRTALFKNDMPSQAKDYIQDKLRSAMWLIRSIHQRQRTLYRVTQSIIKFQKGFLDDGVSQLRPMVLRDVAQDIQMHESTISRVTTNKYVQTPRGLFELKFFFNNRLPTNSGDGVTSESIKATIRQMIGKEDSKHPLSDQQIAETLQGKEIRISRRTIAKYREVLGISPSSRRRHVL